MTKFDWHPSAQMVEAANWTRFLAFVGEADPDTLLKRSETEPEWFWTRLVEYLSIRFTRAWSKPFDMSRGIEHTTWFIGGETNLVLNLLDDKVGPARETLALDWESEEGARRSLTYGQLQAAVARMAAALSGDGFKAGDVIALYLPMIPEAVVAFLAVWKVGCVALPLFSGFGASAVATRLREGGAAAVITADGTRRRGSVVPMDTIVLEAVKEAPSVRRVIVVSNVGHEAPSFEGARSWHDYVAGMPDSCATTSVSSEHPAILLFTSGTTGKPKGIVLSHAGLLVKGAQDSHLYMDLKPQDAFLWMVDLGWLAGPGLLVWTLFAGARLVLAEGVPDYPTPDRHWRLAAATKATIVGVTPSLIRSQRRHGDDVARKHDLSAVRIIVSTAEPWDRDSWLWALRNVGHGEAPIINYSGGTEIGGGILASSPVKPMKAGCFHGPIPGTGAAILRPDGTDAAVGEIGELVMRQPSPGLTRSLWHDPERYLETYWSQFPGVWTQGDLASRDGDDCWFLHGRSDDTIKVSGKRIGPAEIEGALVSTGEVVEAAAIAVPDPRSGNAIVCAVILGAGVAPSPERAEGLRRACAEALGTSFRPKLVLFVSDLPRTRNMKVMRRLIRNALLGLPEGDTTALLNPQAVQELRDLRPKLAPASS